MAARVFGPQFVVGRQASSCCCVVWRGGHPNGTNCETEQRLPLPCHRARHVQREYSEQFVTVRVTHADCNLCTVSSNRQCSAVCRPLHTAEVPLCWTANVNSRLRF